MSISEPLAYLLTWTCYGTWLHGDERGSVDDEHNTPGTPVLARSAPRSQWEGAQLRRSPVELDTRSRRIVSDTITAHCRHRCWKLLAQNVRTNHVHVVVAAPGAKPERVLNQLEAWATRRLREAQHFGANSPVWTHHGSTRYLWNERNIADGVAYVLERQDGNPR